MVIAQRLSKVPIQYKLEKHNIIRQIGVSPEDKPNYATTFSNPLIIIPKGDSIKCVSDARNLDSKAQQSDEPWSKEPLSLQSAKKETQVCFRFSWDSP